MTKDWLPDLSDFFPDDWIWLPIQWKGFGAVENFSGQIEIVSCYRDNSCVRQQLENEGQGKVLFIDGKGDLSRSLLGDMLAEKACQNGWSGIVVHGAVRDIHALNRLPIGIKALGVCPVKTLKRGDGEMNTAIEIAGQVIQPGDYLAADIHGVMVSQTMKIVGTRAIKK